MLMTKMLLANGTWQHILGATQIIFKVRVWSIAESFFPLYMELVKKRRGQFCFSRKAQLESAQSGTGKAQDRERLTPPQNITGDIYYVGDEPGPKRRTGPASSHQSAAKT